MFSKRFSLILVLFLTSLGFEFYLFQIKVNRLQYNRITDIALYESRNYFPCRAISLDIRHIQKYFR